MNKVNMEWIKRLNQGKKNEKFKENGLEKRKKWKNKSHMDSQKLCEYKLKKKEISK